MNRFAIRSFVVCLAAAFLVGAGPVPPPLCAKSKKDCNGLSPCAPSPITSAQTAIPARPCTFQGEGGPLTQGFVDIYSWNIFLALNWPASTGTCSADPSKSILDVKSGDGTFVTWQTYMPSGA